MSFEEPTTPPIEEAERLKKQNKAYTEGMQELNRMSSFDEAEKSEVREMISDKVQKNFEKQQNAEKSPFVKDIEKRTSQASEKIKERVESFFIPSIMEREDRGEPWLRRLQNDFHILAEDPNDNCGGGEYKDWTVDEIKELYFVLYNENLGK